MIYQKTTDVSEIQAKVIVKRLREIYLKGSIIAINQTTPPNNKYLVLIDHFTYVVDNGKCNVKVIGDGIDTWGEVSSGEIYDIETANVRIATKEEIYKMCGKSLFPTLVHNGNYTWKAFSNDGAFEDSAKEPFDTIADCYYAMRSAVLKKMEWNTEYTDFGMGVANDAIMDNIVGSCEENNMAIGYNVQFYPSAIIHESYSGVYYYDIVPCYKNFEHQIKLVNEWGDCHDKKLRDILNRFYEQDPNSYAFRTIAEALYKRDTDEICDMFEDECIWWRADEFSFDEMCNYIGFHEVVSTLARRVWDDADYETILNFCGVDYGQRT